MPKHVSDFLPTLKAAIVEARELGLNDECDELEARAFACYTTSSEFLGECGNAIQEFESRAKKRLTPSIKRQLRFCLVEIGKVWPKYKPWFSGWFSGT